MSYYVYDEVITDPMTIETEMWQLLPTNKTLQKTLTMAIGNHIWWGSIDTEGQIFQSDKFNDHVFNVLPCPAFTESTTETVPELLEAWVGVRKVRITYTMQIDNGVTQYVILDDIETVKE